MASPGETSSVQLAALEKGRRAGPIGTLSAYLRLSGPGWLQSALTLGGGSLASSLYLGVLAGFGLLWLQPLAMFFGIVMLSAIGHVTLVTGKRPFAAINEHINPVLGWGWAIASLVASMVWCMPQYSLATGVLQQNLAPSLLGPGGPLGDLGAKTLIAAAILAIATFVTFSYGEGARGVRIYEALLRLMVAAIVLCFAGVTIKIWLSGKGLDLGVVVRGFIPDPRRILEPSPVLLPLLDAVSPEKRAFWIDLVVSRQRDVLIAAAATAVGINMTFLFPYTLLARGWTKEFAGLAKFDLGAGMFIPFAFATSMVVMASAHSFHGIPAFASEAAPANFSGEYGRLVRSRQAVFPGPLSRAEGKLAAALLTRDAGQLSQSLTPLTGFFFADVVFGLGVLAMTLSTITLLMLVSGFVICEMLGLPPTGWPHRLSSLAAASGVLGPFLWKHASFYLAVPTSVFGMVLLPIAYLTFFFMMNSRRLLGDSLPAGRRRWTWNVLMALAAGIASFASLSIVWSKTGWLGMAGLAGFAALALIFHFRRPTALGKR